MATSPTSRRIASFIAQKFDLADQIIGDRYGYKRPAGGFFLWLDVSAQGGSEAATLALWREAGVRVVPGRYLAREQIDGSNPGADYVRVAMVQDKEITAEALHRLVAVSGDGSREGRKREQRSMSLIDRSREGMALSPATSRALLRAAPARVRRNRTSEPLRGSRGSRLPLGQCRTLR